MLIVRSPVGCWQFYVVTSGPAVHPQVSLQLFGGTGGWGYPFMWTTSAEGLFLQIITSPILVTHEATVSAYFGSGDHEQMEEITRRCCSASFPLGRGCVCDCVYTWRAKHWEALTMFQWWCQSERHQGCYQSVPPDRLSCRDWTHSIQRRKENCDRERKVTTWIILVFFEMQKC